MPAPAAASGPWAAVLALAPAVNSNPIASNWSSALYDTQIEFAHYMPKLEDA